MADIVKLEDIRRKKKEGAERSLIHKESLMLRFAGVIISVIMFHFIIVMIKGIIISFISYEHKLSPAQIFEVASMVPIWLDLILMPVLLIAIMLTISNVKTNQELEDLFNARLVGIAVGAILGVILFIVFQMPLFKDISYSISLVFLLGLGYSILIEIFYYRTRTIFYLSVGLGLAIIIDSCHGLAATTGSFLFIWYNRVE